MSEYATDAEALASVLDRHVTDAAFESGCRLSCGYDGDDLTAHIATALLASDWMRQHDDAVRAETWPCANYTAPITCLTAPSSEPGRCDWCTAFADAVRAEALEQAAFEAEEECRHTSERCFCGSADWLRSRAARLRAGGDA